jgi:inosine-uridine nucleoside N-ribohydrolase
MILKKDTLYLFLCCLLFGIFTGPVVADGPRPVIIDCYMTTDDFMATLLTLKNPDFSVLAITVTGTGWAFCDAGVQAALGIVALAGAGDVPVSCWRDTPLEGDNPCSRRLAHQPGSRGRAQPAVGAASPPIRTRSPCYKATVPGVRRKSDVCWPWVH